MKKVLLVGDFACATGFSTVLQNLAKQLRKNWEVDVLAINYHGDAHPLQKQFNIFPADLEGDVYGIKRFPKFVMSGQYQLIFLLNDIWIIDSYLEAIRGLPKEKVPPIVFYTPVDAKHLKEEFIAPLNNCNHAIFYTQFGANEALQSGLKIPYTIINHGVDMQLFHFMPKKIARKEIGIEDNWYVMLMVDRN